MDYLGVFLQEIGQIQVGQVPLLQGQKLSEFFDGLAIMPIALSSHLIVHILGIIVGVIGVSVALILTQKCLKRKLTAEKRVAQQTSFLTQVVESIPDPFYVVNTSDYSLAMTNSAALKFADIAKGQTCYALTRNRNLPCSGKNLTCPLEKIRSSGKSAVVEHRVKETDGRERIYEIRGYPIFGHDGSVEQVIEYMHDITERKEQEITRERTLRLLKERIKELTCLYNVSRVIRQSSDLAEIFADTVVLIPPAYMHPHIAKARIIYDGAQYASDDFEAKGPYLSSDIVVNKKIRGRIQVFYSGDPPKADEGPFLAEERALIEGLAAMLSEAAERITAQTDREQFYTELEDKNSELERFNYTVSHDLKSPLITIRGFAGMLAEDLKAAKSENIDADLNYIDEAADKMQKLLDELLELSRIGRISNDPEEVMVNELANDAVKLLHERVRQSGVKVNIAADLGTVTGDRARLFEVWQNLIDNAVKFSKGSNEPLVEVGSRLENSERIYFVRDNGKGIDPRFQHKVFGLFEKLEPESEGTGVGLAIVKRIIEHHGGRIWINSDGDGSGTEFCFTIGCPVMV